VLAVIALVVSIFSAYIGVAPQTVTEAGHSAVEALSIGVAIVMLLFYALGLFDARLAARKGEAPHSPLAVTVPHGEAPHVSVWQSLAILALATGGVVWMSETLVHVAEVIVVWASRFTGIILVPIGNVAEHRWRAGVAKNKMT
jgi:calcium/proton exchanger cax